MTYAEWSKTQREAYKDVSSSIRKMRDTVREGVQKSRMKANDGLSISALNFANTLIRDCSKVARALHLVRMFRKGTAYSRVEGAQTKTAIPYGEVQELVKDAKEFARFVEWVLFQTSH